jgi:hypothetical protein
MFNRIVIALQLIACVASVTPLWASETDLAAADWSVTSSRSLASKSPSEDQVLNLLSRLLGVDPSHETLCSFKFADLRHSGNLSLVVSSTNGRFCFLSIIDKTDTGFELYSPEQAHFSEGPQIKDLGRDGNYEVIMGADFTAYQGARHCVATWPVIYAWTGSGYSDVSNEYKYYYRQKLVLLTREAATLSSAALSQSTVPNGKATSSSASIVEVPGHLNWGAHKDTPSQASNEASPSEPPPVTPRLLARFAATSIQKPDPRELDCIEAESGKIERFLGKSDNAGLDDAVRWTQSSNPDEREFGCYVLRDIGTSDAIDHLQTLSNEPDTRIAGIAKRGLLSGQTATDLYKIKRQEIEPLTELHRD